MTLKAIAAETKKLNTLKAQNILDELRKEVGKSESDGGSIVKKVFFSTNHSNIAHNSAISATNQEI